MIRLVRHKRPLPIVSIIPLVDVLLILLVFFMVTSTFLNLDMLPMSETSAPGTSAAVESHTLLVRILPSGEIAAAGQRIAPNEIEDFLKGQAKAQKRLLLLPSPQADVQSLVLVLDTATRTGFSSVNIVQIGADQ